MRHSEDLGCLFAALARAQSELRGAVKDAANPFYKSKYADLASVWDACRDPLAKNELSIVQFPQAEGAKVTVVTRLGHASGQWIESELSAHAKDDSPQAVGSAITYLRRYSLQSVVGVAPEDDDGEAAQDKTAKPAAKAKPAPPNPAIPKDKEGNFDHVGYFRKKIAIENTPEGLDAAVKELAKNKDQVGAEYKTLLVEWFNRAIETAADNERVKHLDTLLANAKPALGDPDWTKLGAALDRAYKPVREAVPA